MSRWAAMCIGVWLGLCVTVSAAADETAVEAEQRRQIQHERSEVEQRFRQGEATCAQRFFVTSCVEALKVQRREALASLRAREIALDEAKRRRDAEESARRVQQKQAEAQARPVPEPRVPPPRASAPAKSDRVTRRSQTADDAAEAAARVLAQQRRASEAEARRDAAELRQAERAAKGKKSIPLPIPAPLPPASAASG